jgi:Choline sulfatase enzyme C terminal
MTTYAVLDRNRWQQNTVRPDLPSVMPRRASAGARTDRLSENTGRRRPCRCDMVRKSRRAAAEWHVRHRAGTKCRLRTAHTPGVNLTRYHGPFAPNHRLRALIVSSQHLPLVAEGSLCLLFSQPFRDASRLYVRDDQDLGDVESMARFPPFQE